MGYMTDERRMIQETARAFVMKEVLPVANKLDPEKGDIPPELIQKLADMGYFGIVIPEEYGGLGLGVFEYCLITEELARAWMSVASIIARGNGLSAGRGMTDAQRKALVIADNQLALNAGWDKDILAIELQALVDLQFDVELTGFSLAEVDFVIEEAGEADPDGRDALVQYLLSRTPL